MAMLQVVFTGSCAFVPNKNQDLVRVLIPNGSLGWLGSYYPNVPVPPHYAYLKIRSGYLNDASRDPDITYKDGEEYNVFILRNEIVDLPTSYDALFIDRSPITPPTWTSAEGRSTLWVPQFGRICTKQDLDSELLKAAMPASLAARVDLTHGIVETHFCRSRSPHQFDPPCEGPYHPYEQDFASAVRVTSTVPDGTSSLEANGSWLLKLTPVASRIEIELGNEVLEDVVAHNLPRDTTLDFEVIFDLMEKGRSHTHVPLPYKNPKKDCFSVFFEPTDFPMTRHAKSPSPDPRATRRRKAVRR